MRSILTVITVGLLALGCTSTQIQPDRRNLPALRFAEAARYQVVDAFPVPAADNRSDESTAATDESPLPKAPRPQTLALQETVVETTQALPLNAQIVQQGNGLELLQLTTDLQSAWVLIEDALRRAQIDVADQDRSIATFYIDVPLSKRPDQTLFYSVRRWFSRIERAELRLAPTQQGVVVGAQFADDTLLQADENKALLQRLQEHLFTNT